MKCTSIVFFALIGLMVNGGTTQAAAPKLRNGAERYRQVVNKTAAMVRDNAARQLASRFGLQVLNVTWEDTGRFKGSCVGTNISDMTIQVQQKNPATGKYYLTCMPVIRYPNFSDKTGDIPLDKFYLLVGNEKTMPLRRITLRQFLADVPRYLSRPDSWKAETRSMLARRDTHALVSAQACFLPIPPEGEATFNPVLFNYQSYEGDPAVLTILVTREGTSVTIIDNKRDASQAGATWGQRLFFNASSERASLTGKRISDFLREEDPREHEAPKVEAADQEGMNMVLLIQVPLKQKKPRIRSGIMVPMATGGMVYKHSSRRVSNVEDAVIGHGEVEGHFTEIDNLAIERDERFPIRITVQFYKATSNGVVTEEDMAAIATQIDKVYDEADYLGSLVVSGETGRPTEYDGPKYEPPGWWDDFWRLHKNNTGMDQGDVFALLNRLGRSELLAVEFLTSVLPYSIFP